MLKGALLSSLPPCYEATHVLDVGFDPIQINVRMAHHYGVTLVFTVMTPAPLAWLAIDPGLRGGLLPTWLGLRGWCHSLKCLALSAVHWTCGLFLGLGFWGVFWGDLACSNWLPTLTFRYFSSLNTCSKLTWCCLLLRGVHIPHIDKGCFWWFLPILHTSDSALSHSLIILRHLKELWKVGN